MSPLASAVQNEKGVALPLALFTLVILSGLLLAFLSMAGMEPQISANLSATARARYLADAGIEWAFDQLVLASSKQPPYVNGWDTVLQTNQGVMTLAGGQTLPGLPAASFGTFSVQVRNDNQPTDSQLTGQPPEPLVNVTTDTNGTLIVTATGTVNGVSRQIQVVMRRISLPPLPGAISLPGVQSNTFLNNFNFLIDGRDFDRNGNLTGNPMKFGIAVQPGIQTNIAPTTFEQNTENAFLDHDSAQKLANIMGKSQTNGQFTTGLNAVAPDASGNPAVFQNFLNHIKAFAGTTVLQSTRQCPLVLSDGVAPNIPRLQSCGPDSSVNLGTTSNPKVTYIKGELDPNNTGFHALTLGGTIQGAGILIVEDGDLQLNGHLRFDGVVLVIGQNVGIDFHGGSHTTIYGGVASVETLATPAPNNSPEASALFMNANEATVRQSQQNIDMVQSMRSFHTLYTWREI